MFNIFSRIISIDDGDLRASCIFLFVFVFVYIYTELFPKIEIDDFRIATAREWREVLMMATREQKHLTKEKYRLAAPPEQNGSENTMTVFFLHLFNVDFFPR